MIKDEGLSIVCSVREHDKEFEEHIKKTIGIKNYETLFYVNPGTFSLTEVYNKGLKEIPPEPSPLSLLLSCYAILETLTK